MGFLDRSRTVVVGGEWQAALIEAEQAAGIASPQMRKTFTRKVVTRRNKAGDIVRQITFTKKRHSRKAVA